MAPEKDYAIIYNPSSAAGKSKKQIEEAQRYLDAMHVSYKLVESTYPGHAIELARQMAKEGYRVIGAGGDGTCNEILHGVMTSNSKALCGFIPMGTGNDIPAAIGIVPEIKRACEILKEGTIGKSDVGFARTDKGVERYFLGIGSQGFDAEVTRRTNLGKKRFKGTLNYYVTVLKTILGWPNRPIRVKMDSDTFEGMTNCIAVANGPSYGGGMYICQQARVHDGMFHISVVHMSKFVMLRDFNQMYDASVLPHPDISEYTSKKVRIEMVNAQDIPYLCQVDGEVLGEIPVNYESLPDAQEFIMPKCDEVSERFIEKYGRDFHEYKVKSEKGKK